MLSYRALVEIFWSSHNPCSSAWSRQYQNCVFYHSEAQRQAAEEVRDALFADETRAIQTAVLPATEFTLAEDYHQKYRLRQDALLEAELTARFPKLEDFVASPTVTRINAWLAGHGSAEQLAAELPRLGLSAEAEARLRERVEGRLR